MILSTLLLLCGALPADSPRTLPAASTVELKTTPDVADRETVDVKPATKPDAPTPKVAPSSDDSPLMLEPLGGAIQPAVNGPTRPATTESFETPRQRKIWYGLMAAGHGAAAFDAWTTRRAVSSGYGVESDPTQRPFAHSGAIYATTQLSPLLMDYVGHRMMRSKSPMLRKFWWVPQAANASISLGAAIHNYRVVP